MTIKRYNRKTTGITISIFYEQYQLKKYNFDPPYQRDYNVWETEQKSFLIDTIMKNFPIPPIFLEQKINIPNGKTRYDVIDGKQRLSAIIDFIENKIKLPETYGNDSYGSSVLNAKSFDEIQKLAESDEEIRDLVSSFWGYVLSIEYIENPDSKIVDNIFDRLNRGGERLNEQELRKANYYDTIMYQEIENLRKDGFISELLNKTKKDRLADISFITELYLLMALDSIIEGTESQIDKHFSELVESIDKNQSDEIIKKIKASKKTLEKFELDYDQFKIKGVSHLYAIWYLAYFMNKNNLEVDSEFLVKLKEFFEDLRGNRTNENTKEYHKSMQSASKSKSSRKKRIMALLNYFGFSYEETKL
jgi:hypothetical protein